MSGTAPVPSRTGAASRGGPATGSGIRPEIQLLRAFAVLAVVTNHVAPGRLTGGYVGVDVFFVISGFLITSHLVRELDRTGSIRLVPFWARRARRLLPASLLVLLVCAVATLLVVPVTLQSDVMREITASALYFQNWALAHDATDYFASSGSPSPVTHYWSLSLEEQFYLVWPLLALAAYAAGRRLGRPRAGLAVVFALVVAASLAYSVVETAASPSSAYFVTPTRMWQLGLGGLLALTPALARGRTPVALAGWGALAASVVLLDEHSAVPGWVALAPVLGTVAVIWAGDALVGDPPRVLRPLRRAGMFVGDISYSLYLWHWPPLVLLPYALGRPLGPATTLAVVVGMFVLAWASKVLVEDPVRTSAWLGRGRQWRTFVPAAAAMALVTVVAQQAAGTDEERIEQAAAQVRPEAVSDDECFGARALRNDCERPHRLRYVDSALLGSERFEPDHPAMRDSCHQDSGQPGITACEWGVPAGEARLRVALVGDSHARHWWPALDALAERHRWSVVQLTKGSCPVTRSEARTRRFPEYVETCHAWVDRVTERVARDDSVDVVVTSANARNYVVAGLPRDEQVRRMAAGYRDVWREWLDAGKEVVVVGNVPRLGHDDVPTCVAESSTRSDPCAAPRDEALGSDPMLAAATGPDAPDVGFLDVRDDFCDARTCHAVVGGVVAYSDGNHVMPFFARTLAPRLEALVTDRADARPRRPGR